MKKMLMVVAATVAVFGAAYADGEKVKSNNEGPVVTNHKKVFFVQHKADDGVNTVTETVDENGNVLSRSVTCVHVMENIKSEYFKDGKAVNGGTLVNVIDCESKTIDKVENSPNLVLARKTDETHDANVCKSETCGCEKSVGGVRRRVARPWEARKKVVTADLANTNVAVRVRRGGTKDSKPFIQKFDSSLTNGVNSLRGNERIDKMRKRREARKMSKDKVFECVRRAREYNRKMEAEEKRNGRVK